MGAAMRNTVDEVGKAVAEEGIACDWVKGGTVTLALDSRYKFPKDTSAKIQTSGLLGEQYIGLEPGGDAASIAPGDTISMTQSAVVLENLIGQFLFNRAADGGPSAPAQ